MSVIITYIDEKTILTFFLCLDASILAKENKQISNQLKAPKNKYCNAQKRDQMSIYFKVFSLSEYI